MHRAPSAPVCICNKLRIISIIISRKMRRVARMKSMRIVNAVLGLKKPRARDHQPELGVDKEDAIK